MKPEDVVLAESVALIERYGHRVTLPPDVLDALWAARHALPYDEYEKLCVDAVERAVVALASGEQP
jgi:hypothetical protein